MKKRLLLACLLLCAALLCACAPMQTPIVETPLVPRVDTAVPGVSDAEGLSQQSTVVLYYRYLDEPFLASETRSLTQLPGQSYDMALLTELLAGPGTRSPELTSPFPAGLRVLSTVRQGRTLFVTLSAEIMSGYADEPQDWQRIARWQTEVPLRRQLCLQAIVATVTENSDVDRVQFLTQASGVTGSLRLTQAYFAADAQADAVTGPIARDPSLLLTSDAALDTILACWQAQDWARLYLYVTTRDPLTGQERPDYRTFVARMEPLPRLAGYQRSSGTSPQDGASATYVVSARLIAADMSEERSDCILHLCRENGLWKISLAQLTGWLEE